ncbi:hypothetical protein COY27_05325 [Candidatus Woesearchaeota archaeon CG_4_10_14_0_2_um_filter_33_13]|nr:MAG: hypothetical protein COY27_05325 [Candidatus Woesearchaeota archaeon CG_4_10_14_0_2_um_filter_33_13]
MLTKGVCLRFYKRKDIQDAILEHARNKEVSVMYGLGKFGKRPDILMYPRDVLEMVMKGATSFHSSEEIWENPLNLNSDLNRKDLDSLRQGWDLVLDIDCKFIDYSKISADLIIKFLRYCEVKDISIKFSGNKGFHIGVPFESFPNKLGNLNVKDLFPEAPRKIAAYIKENIKLELSRRILEFENGSFTQVKDKVELPQEDIIRYVLNEFGDRIARLDVDKFLEIDTVLIAPRHLYRMPYSLHEKSGLASFPIDPDTVLNFKKPMADPDKLIVPKIKFIDRENVTPESSRRLLVQAWDYEVKVTEDYKAEKETQYEEIEITCPITEDFFPPCIKRILQGLDDGKKRAIFILSNFLGKIGWSKKEIEDYLLKWNREKNKDPLRDNYIKSQMRFFKPGEKLPPNCDNEAYYKSMGICNPDALCGRLKNPVNYTLLRWRSHLKVREEQEKEDAKALKKEEREKAKEEKINKKIEEDKEAKSILSNS